MGLVIVGIGCDHAQELAAEVLIHSIRLQGQSNVDVVKLNEVSAWNDLSEKIGGQQKTPFSFQRFLLAGHLLETNAEVGIYVDSDMLVLRPLDELLASFTETALDIATVSTLKQWRRKDQSSVMIFTRAGAERLWNSYLRFLHHEIGYDQLIYLRTVDEVGAVPYAWNCLEYLDETTALIHYTDMDTQPWLRDGNPNAGIWYTYLWRYTRTDKGSALLDAEIKHRHVRPALKEIAQFGSSISSFSTKARTADIFFIPPHRFRRLRSATARKMLAPFLRGLISLQFLLANGQPNIR